VNPAPGPAPILICADALIAGHTRIRRRLGQLLIIAFAIAVCAVWISLSSWKFGILLVDAAMTTTAIAIYYRQRDHLYQALQCPHCNSRSGQLLWGIRAVYDCRDCGNITLTDCRMSHHRGMPGKLMIPFVQRPAGGDHSPSR